MGQILSQPETEKHSESGGSSKLAYALSAMQGWRINMEDAHTTVLRLNNEGEEEEEEDIAFFGVYDGHGGDKIAQFTGENLHKIVREQEQFVKGNYGKALQDAFLAADTAIKRDDAVKNDQSGCTATTVLITKEKIICANAGDSRTVLSVNGDSKPLSYDHKPNNEGEHARICAAGGFVNMGRVNGNLALSRAIGDFDFKKSHDLPPEEQIVTAFPDVIEHVISKDDEFVVLACDGIWDCLTSQQVVEIVRRGIHDGKSLEEICEGLIDICLAPTSQGSGIGCDNMSVVIVALLQGKSLEEWYQSIISKENTPVSISFEEISKEIYNEEEQHFLQNQDQGQFGIQTNNNNDDDGNSEDMKTTFSIQQLLEHNVLTSQNGVFYLDSSNLLNSLVDAKNVANDDDNEEEEAQQTITEVDEEEEEEEQGSK